jgi:hypothetical protein
LHPVVSGNSDPIGCGGAARPARNPSEMVEKVHRRGAHNRTIGSPWCRGRMAPLLRAPQPCAGRRKLFSPSAFGSVLFVPYLFSLIGKFERRREDLPQPRTHLGTPP